jgi:hypothetical protein
MLRLARIVVAYCPRRAQQPTDWTTTQGTTAEGWLRTSRSTSTVLRGIEKGPRSEWTSRFPANRSDSRALLSIAARASLFDQVEGAQGSLWLDTRHGGGGRILAVIGRIREGVS